MSEASQRRLFVLHAPADEEWVKGVLRPRLRLMDGELVTFRDFTPGEPLLDELQRMIASCPLTVAIFSENFRLDPLSRAAQELASHSAYLFEESRFATLVLDDVALPLHLRSRVIIDARDESQFQRQLDRVAHSIGVTSRVQADVVPCPYPGMVPFAAADADRFFGRESEISAIVGRLEAGAGRIVVIGPSGSGKSSLLAAGVVPNLGADKWSVHPMRPAAAATWSLAEALDALPQDKTLLWLIDQFEETFTTLGQHTELFSALTAALNDARCVVVLAMRADFYGNLMGSPLWPLLPEQRMEIAPLTGGALKEAIQKPAHKVGVVVAADLIERLMADVKNQHGSLPFLQETLRALWDRAIRRGDRLLRVNDYDALSRDGRTGLELAVAARADAALAALPSESRFDAARQRSIIQRTLIRLIQFGEKITRRQQHWDDLRSAGDDDEEFDATLRYLTDQRLITTSENRVVDLSHEALISGWRTLQDWIAAAESAEQVRRYYEDAARNWHRMRCGDDGRLDEGELAELKRWGFGSQLGVTPLLGQLIEYSSRRLKEEGERLLTEERQRTRSRERMLRVLGVILGVAMTALGAVWWLYKGLQHQKDLILVQRLVDLSRNSLVDDHENDERAALYARQAFLLNRELNGPYNGLVYEAMRRILYDRYFVQVLPQPGDNRSVVIEAHAVSPNGRWAIVYDNDDSFVAIDEENSLAVPLYDNRLLGWDLQARTAHPRVIDTALAAGSNPRLAVANNGIAVVLSGCTAQVVDIQNAKILREIAIDRDRCYDIAIAPSGMETAVATTDGVQRIALRTDANPLPLRADGPVLALAYFHDSARMATISKQTMQVWSLRESPVMTTLLRKPNTNWDPANLRLSPQGETLAFQDSTSSVAIDLTEQPPQVWLWYSEFEGFHPDGRMVLSKEGQILIQDRLGTSESIGRTRLAALQWSAVGSAISSDRTGLSLLTLPRRMLSIDNIYREMVVTESGGKRKVWFRHEDAILTWDPLESAEPQFVARGYASLCTPSSDGVWAIKEKDKTGRIVRIDGRGRETYITGFEADRVRCEATMAPDVIVRTYPRSFMKFDGKALKPFRLPSQCSSRFAFSASGNYFACATHESEDDQSDKSLLLGKIAPAAEPRRIPQRELPELVFSPDSQQLAASRREVIHLIPLDDRFNIESLHGHARKVTGLAFAADGSFLASGSEDETVILWPRHGREEEKWILATGNAQMLVFLDNEHLIWSDDGRVSVLDLSLQRMADRICEVVGRNLTEEEWRTALPDRNREATCPGLPLP